jgi:hypothetical protein
MKYRDIELEHDKEYYDVYAGISFEKFKELSDSQRLESMAYNMAGAGTLYAVLIANYVSKFGNDGFLTIGPLSPSYWIESSKVASLVYACLKTNKRWNEYWKEWGRRLGYSV